MIEDVDRLHPFGRSSTGNSMPISFMYNSILLVYVPIEPIITDIMAFV